MTATRALAAPILVLLTILGVQPAALAADPAPPAVRSSSGLQ